MKIPIEASSRRVPPPMSLSMTDIRADDDKKSEDSDKRLEDGKLSAWDDVWLWEEEEDGFTYVERARYWKGVWESDGFDVEGTMKKPRRRPYNGLIPFYIERPDDCPTEIVLYAKFGIHWYNMLQGTNLQFSCVQKYNYLCRCVKSDKYITCLAMDPVCGSTQVFQTGILEEGFAMKSICCFIARPKFVKQEKPVEPSIDEEAPEEYNYGERTLPEWPSANALRDKSQFYLLKKSDLKKYDWIHLYLELAFVKANRKLKNPDLSKLLILSVAVQSRQEILDPPAERLKAVNSVFYIKYKYPPTPSKGRGAPKGVRSLKPPSDRFAIIKRTVDKPQGHITLMFDTKTLL